MSRAKHLAALAIVAAVSVVFGMLLASGPLRNPGSEEPAVWAPAQAAAPAASALAPPAALPSFAEVAAAANPAVVSVRNTEFKKASSPRGDQFDLPFEDPFRWFFGPRERGPGRGDDEGEQRVDSRGSGFLISEDGYILTNYHVVESASRLEVAMENGETFEAKLVGKDEDIDLALIKIDARKRLPFLRLGDSDSLRVGEWVIAIGNPLGYDHTVTVGVVSGKGRQLNAVGGSVDISLANFIQTDAAINFGNSGGPLLNARGEVVGINTAITRNGGPFQGLIQGIGFALPASLARSAVEQLRETGRVARGYLGISVTNIREAEQKAFDLPSTSGALVQDVMPDLPAERAGVQEGDVIVSINGTPVRRTEELIQMVSARRPGETVTLGILRDGAEKTIRVKLVDRAQARGGSAEGEEEGRNGGADSETGASDRVGIRVGEITPDFARRHSVPEDFRGVGVVAVRQTSRAWEEGLREGWVITKVDSTEVRTVRQFRDTVSRLRPGDYVRLYAVDFDRQNPQGIGRFFVFKIDK